MQIVLVDISDRIYLRARDMKISDQTGLRTIGFFNEEEVKREPLGVIGEFQRGKRFVKDDMIYDGVPSPNRKSEIQNRKST